MCSSLRNVNGRFHSYQNSGRYNSIPRGIPLAGELRPHPPLNTHTHTQTNMTCDVWRKQASSQINCVLLSGVADVRRKSRVRRYSDWCAVGRHSRALFWRVYCYITTHITFISIFMEYTLKIRFTFVSWNQRSLPRLFFYKVTTTPDIGQWVWACTIVITCTRVRCITCVIW